MILEPVARHVKRKRAEGLGRGAVNWRRALGALKDQGFDGAISVHTEYDFDESIIRRVGYAEARPPHLEEWACADAAFLRTRWREGAAGNPAGPPPASSP